MGDAGVDSCTRARREDAWSTAIQSAAAEVGIVVIGRNEGDRLRQCFNSLESLELPMVYVDSGSSDGSVSLARGYTPHVVELEPTTPFSAGRARNEGFSRLINLYPQIRFVQFVDGDCALSPGWIAAAAQALSRDTVLAAVIGHLEEKGAGEWPYGRLCAMEWHSEAGVVSDFGKFGGITMIRADGFRALGGYNPIVIAGQDSELGVRMRLAGYRIDKLDVAMAAHEAGIHSFSQWWRRAVRAGHAIAQRAHLNGGTPARDCVRERASTWFWGILLPFGAIAAAVPTRGLSLMLFAGYPVLAARILRRRLNGGDHFSDAFLYTAFTILAKFANGVGLIRFHLNQLRGRYEIISNK